MRLWRGERKGERRRRRGGSKREDRSRRRDKEAAFLLQLLAAVGVGAAGIKRSSESLSAEHFRLYFVKKLAQGRGDARREAHIKRYNPEIRSTDDVGVDQLHVP